MDRHDKETSVVNFLNELGAFYFNGFLLHTDVFICVPINYRVPSLQKCIPRHDIKRHELLNL